MQSITRRPSIPVSATIVTALIVGTVFVATIWSSHDTSAATALDPEEQAFLALINQERTDNRVAPLSVDVKLEGSARWMSGDMATNNYFSHVDSLGRDPFQRMCDFGYCYNTWKGENLAAGVATGQATFNLWRDSSEHDANMLNANYLAIGIARAYDANSNYGWYWTADFGGVREPMGDVDCSSGVNALDALLLLSTLAKLQPPAACIGAGDVNCDGGLNAVDALLILRYAAGLPLTLPLGCPPIG